MKTAWFAVAAFVSWLGVSAARAGEGADFEARDPMICPPEMFEPERGPIDADTATAYLRCDNEYYSTRSGDLHLIELTPLSVGEPRQFDINTDPSAADSDQPVHDIAADHHASYLCSEVDGSNRGQNCAIIEVPNATGVCFKTRQGNWRCTMSIGAKYQRHRGPPPT